MTLFCAHPLLSLSITSITLFTLGTAGDDYSPVNSTIIFVPDQEAVHCLNISITDDDILESTESFTLSLSVTNGTSEYATVYILDNECKNHAYACTCTKNVCILMEAHQVINCVC